MIYRAPLLALIFFGALPSNVVGLAWATVAWLRRGVPGIPWLWSPRAGAVLVAVDRVGRRRSYLARTIGHFVILDPAAPLADVIHNHEAHHVRQFEAGALGAAILALALAWWSPVAAAVVWALSPLAWFVGGWLAAVAWGGDWYWDSVVERGAYGVTFTAAARRDDMPAAWESLPAEAVRPWIFPRA